MQRVEGKVRTREEGAKEKLLYSRCQDEGDPCLFSNSNARGYALDVKDLGPTKLACQQHATATRVRLTVHPCSNGGRATTIDDYPRRDVPRSRRILRAIDPSSRDVAWTRSMGFCIRVVLDSAYRSVPDPSTPLDATVTAVWQVWAYDNAGHYSHFKFANLRSRDLLPAQTRTSPDGISKNDGEILRYLMLLDPDRLADDNRSDSSLQFVARKRSTFAMRCLRYLWIPTNDDRTIGAIAKCQMSVNVAGRRRISTWARIDWRRRPGKCCLLIFLLSNSAETVTMETV
ncbi:hypothetical protein EAG_14596 [Camponotus floridanus]|uniref:Uncharacterized protein n=1 Tax=Camponotus floridanus TaxID=104421 RepID=E1ZXP0_CAMFO|nr:hypothetical protein EAG_14596 [Camponotus floridanus]